MLKIGLTGGIGAGKSTAAALFTARGIPVIDSDVVAREIVEPGQPALEALRERFGESVLKDGELDRAELARLAFADAESTRALNDIMHPAIAQRTRELFAEHADAPIVVHDVPLLAENGLEDDYDLVVVVGVPAEVRLQRLVELRGMDEADARQRILRQASDDQRQAIADVVLDNSGTPEEFEERFADAFQNVIEPAARKA